MGSVTLKFYACYCYLKVQFYLRVKYMVGMQSKHRRFFQIICWSDVIFRSLGQYYLSNVINNHNKIWAKHDGWRTLRTNNMEEELFDAVECGDVFGVLHVFKTYPDSNVNIRDRLGRTPLCLAVTHEHEEVNVLFFICFRSIHMSVIVKEQQCITKVYHMHDTNIWVNLTLTFRWPWFEQASVKYKHFEINVRLRSGILLIWFWPWPNDLDN